LIGQEDWDPGNIRVDISWIQAGEGVAQAIGMNNQEDLDRHLPRKPRPVNGDLHLQGKPGTCSLFHRAFIDQFSRDHVIHGNSHIHAKDPFRVGLTTGF